MTVTEGSQQMSLYQSRGVLTKQMVPPVLALRAGNSYGLTWVPHRNEGGRLSGSFCPGSESQELVWAPPGSQGEG